MAHKKTPRRSTEWFGKADKDGFAHRSWLRNQGLPNHLFDGRPVIGICNTWSELTPCNAHMRTLAERVKRGVYEAGGFPLEFPVMSMGEPVMRPTAMLFRNLASHGRRGIDPRQPAGRRGAAGRLRQDHAVAVDGRGQLRHCRRLRPVRWADAERLQVPRRGPSAPAPTIWKFSEMVKRAGEMTLASIFMDAEAGMRALAPGTA